MTRTKQLKKTDTLEVRLPHGVKKAFMARARSRGRTASWLVREFVESYLADTDPAMERRKMLKRFATPAAVTSLIAAAIALHMPTAASAAPDLKALFDQLDRDRNSQLSGEEFVVRDSGALHSTLRQADLGSMLPLMLMLHSGAVPTTHAPAAEGSAKPLRVAFASQDRDGDGVVSFGEFESHNLAALRQAFDMIDADKDGGVEPAELERMMNHLPRQIAAHAKPFAELDGDASGAISWAEFQS